MFFTPWAENTKDAKGAMEALKATKVQCEQNFVLNFFVLEAKDPGDSQSELRYDYECCAVSPFMPLSVLVDQSPSGVPFGAVDAVYFPTGKVEGMVEMAAFFKYQTGQPDAGLKITYDKFKGLWCVGSKCVAGQTDHVLQLGAAKGFDVTGLDLQAEEEEAAKMKDIKFTKFKRPPRIERIALKKRKLDAFKPSKKLAAFDMSSVASWIPQTPMYKPYCALRDAKQWKSIEEAGEEELSGWGVDGRNVLDVLNSEENLERTKDVRGQDWHPCRHYFADVSEVDRPAFTSDFGVVDLSGVDKVLEKVGVEADPEQEWDPQLGHTLLSEERCEERKIKRKSQQGQDEIDSKRRQNIYDQVLSVGSPICAHLPVVGTVMAPLGGGASIDINTPKICEEALKTAHRAGNAFEDIWLVERTEWNRKNAQRDDKCGDIGDMPGHMYKVYCDMHCLEDAVLKGNSAILRTMKSLESHIVTTLHDIIKHYTTETFEKIKETQSQITHNDKQTVDILTDYVGQIMNQNTEYTTALNKAIGGIVPPLNKLQKDIITVNKNLITVKGWLKSNSVLNPPKLLQQGVLHETNSSGDMPETNSSIAELHQALSLASDSAMGIVQDLHREPSGAKGFDEETIAAQLLKAQRVLRGRGNQAKEQLLRGDLPAARGHVLALARELQVARAVIARKNDEPTAETFQRRSAKALRPAWAQLGQQFVAVARGQTGLEFFRVEQRAVLGRAATLGELSDQAERYAAAEMMVRFDAEISKAQRSFNDYLQHAQEHLAKRSQALIFLGRSSRTAGCQDDGLVQLGHRLAEMDRAEHRARVALHRAWQDSAESLSRLADLLVDGGLLLHHLRLAAASIREAPAKQGLEEQLAMMEAPLHQALAEDGGNFVQQVDRAFTMGQLLADSWSTSGLHVPDPELRELRLAWAKLSRAAGELRDGLRPGGALRRELLLRSLEAVHGPLEAAFPVPPACRTETGAMLWRSQQNSALLLTRAGALLHCDLKTKKIVAAAGAKENASGNGINLGDFLSFIAD